MGKQNNVDPWEELANAIVIKAAADWRRANKRLRRNPYNGAAHREIDEIEKFFMSGWYTVLTAIPGERLIKMLKEEADNETKRI